MPAGRGGDPSLRRAPAPPPGRRPPQPGAVPTQVAAPTGPISLDGWKLTLPIAGSSGGAASVDPARLSPPWLTEGPTGGLTFWAPADGATTPHSQHPRTELNSLDDFKAGSGVHTLTVTASVAQVPADGQDVIIGQIHGTGDISSVPFVMLHYRVGIIEVVVKREQTGSSSDRYPLLFGVPLGARFDFSIRDDGNGTLTFAATYGDQTATKDAPVPAAFQNAPVRFQAGSYQQSEALAGQAPDGDGARVTFYAVTTG